MLRCYYSGAIYLWRHYIGLERNSHDAVQRASLPCELWAIHLCMVLDSASFTVYRLISNERKLKTTSSSSKPWLSSPSNPVRTQLTHSLQLPVDLVLHNTIADSYHCCFKSKRRILPSQCQTSSTIISKETT